MFTFVLSTEAKSCPEGTSFHKISNGKILFARRTIAEGCFTDFEAAQLRMDADAAKRLDVNAHMQRINANRQRQCFGSAKSYGNYTYGSVKCY